uniref:Zn(2)-C6 fungal-type domain-containing protein n=1 Tax=Bionectria ochroleuca TaxID=29856 RepID=A0A0B7KR82_BIOOC
MSLYSTGDEVEKSSPKSRSFKRSYVACVSCRVRKVRCVINGDPPCAKCRREHRECEFDRRPKAPKQREPPKWAKRNQDNRAAVVPPEDGEQWIQNYHGPSPQSDPAAGPGMPPIDETANLHRDAVHGRVSPRSQELLYNRVIATPLTGTHDALEVLSDAVPRGEPAVDLETRTITPSLAQNSVPSPTQGPTVIPTTGGGLGFTVSVLSSPDEATLDLWDRSRFVRQGWFTAQEAVTYIDLFYKYLSPLSAVILDDFCSHSAHSRLVTEEAMLCCTILMISSRFFMLPGAGGLSRSHLIHHRLWNFCESLIKRIMLGQEKHSSWRMRVVGTIESLMLISDWHPRAVHFPPETEGWDVFLISPDYDRTNRVRNQGEEPLIRWREDVFEPAKRASRMSWMLLGMANSLAYEIGIFSSQDQQKVYDPLDSDGQRHLRVQKLLYTYISQTAIKLNMPSPFPDDVINTATRSTFDQSLPPSYQPWSAYMDLNSELTRLSRTASSMFFQTPAQLQAIVSGGHHLDLLEHFSGSLTRWLERAETLFHRQPLRDCLLIEYHHLKILTGAVAIQSVVAKASAAGIDGNTKGIEDINLATFLTPRDGKFLQQVIRDCKKLLHIATHSIFHTQFPYAPARIKISVISTSVFLLKALSIGSSSADVHQALKSLDQCTQMLKSSPPDDTDFAMRYATLIEKHTANIRDRLVPHSAASGSMLLPPATDGSQSQQTGLPLPTQNLSTVAYSDSEIGDSINSWISFPFDSSIAPFNQEQDTQLSLGLDLDSLDFLWNLPLS